MKDPKKVKMGKKSKAAGAAFELRVRKDLEEEGWIVDKWSNNIDLEKGKIIPAKHKFRGMGIPMAMGTGFPDFIAIRPVYSTFVIHSTRIVDNLNLNDGPNDEVRIVYEAIGVEVKTNGYLDKTERAKCKWYLDNRIFSKILIAEKIKEGGRVKITYHDFEEKYGKEN